MEIYPHQFRMFILRSLLLSGAFLLSQAAPLSAAGPGDQAPAIVSSDFKSGAVFKLEDLKGHVVLLDFWASWCGPCRKSFPFIDGLQTRYAAQGLKVVGVSLDENPDAVTSFLESFPVGFAILHDPSAKTAEAYGVVAMPTSFLIDAEGRIVARFEGGEHLKEEEAAINALRSGAKLGKDSDIRVAPSVQATGDLKAWKRGHLADPIMQLDGDSIARSMREHIHESKEGAAGDGGSAGGGCGCN